MANRLKMAITNTILGLLAQGWSRRKIARELGVHRETVGRYAQLQPANSLTSTAQAAGPEIVSKPATQATPGSGAEDSKPAKATPGSQRGGQPSQCEPFRQIILEKIEQGLEGVRIWQDLRADHGFCASYSSVKRFLRALNISEALPFRRMECAPGEEAQVDFGRGAWTLKNGKKRRPHVLRVVLSHSRKAFSVAVWRQTTESFIRALERAFQRFGGVTKTVVIDNLKAAVTHADWFDPDLNPKLLAFQRHCGFVLLPTRPRMPRHKGKVERTIDYVQENALKGRLFDSLEDQNAFLLDWEEKIADTRIHGTTRKQVRRLFEDVERKTLQPLSAEPFPLYDEGRRKVHRDGHIEVEKSYYSVPPEYLGHEVWVRWDDRLVRVCNADFEQIALHARALPGKFCTAREHLCDKKISSVERGAEYLLSKAYRMGADAGRWGEAMLLERGIEGVRVLQGLLSLPKHYPVEAIAHACRHALKVQCFRLRPLRELCKRLSEKETVLFSQESPLIRPLSEYGKSLKVSFQPES